MPRIRKKTSNRQNTRDRAKITKKAAEQKRKNRKASKKDQTWKSKKKADPGVPNSFPFKDQVLAEIAEEKRKSEEDKIARREAAKAQKSTGAEDEADTPGVSSLGRTVLDRVPLTATSSIVVTPSEDFDIPELIDTALPTLQEALDRADVICEVVDARDVLGGRSGYIEKLVKETEGRIILIINKIDLVPREVLQSWISQLDIPTFLFKSALPVPPTPSSSRDPGPSFFLDPSVILGREQLIAAAKKWSAEKKKSRKSDEPLVLALMGLPSVGKTSILNSLVPSTANKSRRVVAPLIPSGQSAKSLQPTTKTPVEVEIDVDGLKLKVIDTPGWEPVEDEKDEDEDEDEDEQDPEKWDRLEAKLSGDLLRRNLGRVDRVKDVFPLVSYIVERSNHQDLMLAYNIPFFEKGDLEAFLTGLARAQQRIRKHGEPDLEGAARVLLRDWAHNNFPYYSLPSSTSASKMDVDGSNATDKYDMTEILEKCRGKKEMKKESSKGMIRFKGGEIDEREIILDDDYTAMMTATSDDDDDEIDDEEEIHEEQEDEDEDGIERASASDDEPHDELDDEPVIIGSDEGEVLELSEGTEPSESGSSPEPELRLPSPSSFKPKKRRISEASVAPAKKAKRVSFARNVPGGKEEKNIRGGKKGNGRK
ncbi:nuclear GTP-binding protein [Cryptococcus neoformans var. grubii Br795]|nr:nuclear GTP-binding protein [Cryptococcus neoformans var. grubii Br795]